MSVINCFLVEYINFKEKKPLEGTTALQNSSLEDILGSTITFLSKQSA